LVENVRKGIDELNAPVVDNQKRYSLAASIGRNTLFGIVANVAQVGARFVTVPIVIHHLGLEGYGIWSVLMSVAAYMSLGGAGVKSAFQKYAAEATGSGDFERASKLISTGTAAVLLISITALVPVALFSHQLAGVAGVPPRFLNSAAHAILLMAFMMILINAGGSYQAILMGAHRIDLQKKLYIASMVAGSIATIIVLRFGFGLLAMSAVFGGVEMAGLLGCCILSRRVIPAIEVAPKHLSRSVLRELITFGGSYQLVSILEALCSAILPVAVLKFYGASAAGVLALASRVVAAALLPQGTLLQPILSGGSFVYASSTPERMRLFLLKSFNATLALSFTPLAFVGCFGTMIVLVWTGQLAGSLREVLWLLCLGGLFRSLSSLARVLYRVSGRSLMDNVQLLSMLLVLTLVCAFARQLGLLGMIAGTVFAQLGGMVLMWLTLTATFQGFTVRSLAPQILKFVVATTAILAAAVIVAHVGAPWNTGARFLAAIRLGAVTLVSLAVAGPALLLTGSVSRSEARTLLDTLRGGASVRA
jgi:O-antigen/teichoic acid export membrane protein